MSRPRAAGSSPDVTDADNPETTSGGLVGKLAGKAKDVAGRVIGDEDLAREGRLQDAAADADITAQKHAAEAQRHDQAAQLEQEKADLQAEQQRLQTEVAADQREDQIEADRRQAEQQAETTAAKERADAARTEQAAQANAETQEELSHDERIAREQEAAELEEQARKTEARADVIDPKE